MQIEACRDCSQFWRWRWRWRGEPGKGRDRNDTTSVTRTLPWRLNSLIWHGVSITDWILLFLNSALNPVLYSLMSDSFRRGAREVLYPRRRRAPVLLNAAQAAAEAPFRNGTALRLPVRRNSSSDAPRDCFCGRLFRSSGGGQSTRGRFS
ncbi:hypothetical protein BaRGS_00018404 [Batillaria attramentaria]|uniref:Uncharacterized protein n=1 Tax=Batillaria attramentaria TaxID=370345 RepID=A0ABD0KTB8_9CAEN